METNARFESTGTVAINTAAEVGSIETSQKSQADNEFAKNTVEGFSREEITAFAMALDGTLTPILTTYGGQIVTCHRLGGVEISLSQAVNQIWPPTSVGAMLLEGLPSVMAEIDAMLATIKNSTEEAEDEIEKQELLNQDQTDTPSTEQLELQDVIIPKKDELLNEAKTETKLLEMERQTAEVIEKAQAEPEPKPIMEILRPEPREADDAPPIAETIKPITELQSQAVEEVQTAIEPIQLVAANEPEPMPLDNMIEEEITAKIPEVEQPLTAEVLPDESELPLAATIENIIDEELVVETVEPEAAVEPLAIQPEENLPVIIEQSPIEMVEEEIIAIQIDEDIVSRETEVEQPAIELAVETETIELDETLIEDLDLSAKLEDIETTVDDLALAMETSSPEETEAATAVLDEIAETVAMIGQEDEDNGLSQAEAQAKIEELLIQLFDKLNLDYTPEVIESLAKLTVHGFLKTDLKQPQAAGDELPHDVGTHEIIVKIKAGLSWLKKTIANAWALGRSALQLCSYKFSTHVQLKLLTSSA